MQNNPVVFSAVALIDFQSANLRPADVVNQARQMVSRGVRGFRLHSLGDAHTWPDNPLMQALWRTAAEDGFTVCPLSILATSKSLSSPAAESTCYQSMIKNIGSSLRWAGAGPIVFRKTLNQIVNLFHITLGDNLLLLKWRRDEI